MTYVLFIVFASYGWGYKGLSVSEMKSKAACEIALKEAKRFWAVDKDDSKCIEVRAK